MQKEEKNVQCREEEDIKMVEIASSPCCLRSPKKEEEVVTVVPMPAIEDADAEVDIMDELDNILSINDDDDDDDDDEEKIGKGIVGNVEWDLIAWDEFPKEDYDEETMKMGDSLDQCDNDSSNCVIKREYLSFWEEEKKTISLNLNYQEVLDAWSDGRSPWADEYSLSMSNDSYVGEVPVMEEEKMRREARVLRYKEKRQSRLFSKTIRYQVRKLNAEKRPRFKGRFVKRVPDKMLR